MVSCTRQQCPLVYISHSAFKIWVARCTFIYLFIIHNNRKNKIWQLLWNLGQVSKRIVELVSFQLIHRIHNEISFSQLIFNQRSYRVSKKKWHNALYYSINFTDIFKETQAVSKINRKYPQNDHRLHKLKYREGIGNLLYDILQHGFF